MSALPDSHFPLILSDKDVWGRYFATIEPAGSRWLPWRGRMSRWWFEIERFSSTDEEYGEIPWTLAYEAGGSGGGFTLRKCILRAADALDTFTTRESDEGYFFLAGTGLEGEQP